MTKLNLKRHLIVLVCTLAACAASIKISEAQDGAATATPAPMTEAAPAPMAEAAPAPMAEAAPAPAAPVPDSLGYAPGLNGGAALDLQWPIPADISGNDKPTLVEVTQNVAHNKIAINTMWTLICGFLVMFMQAGFALVETGLCRGKNAAHVMATNFMIYGLGMLGFWVCGFGFMFGGYWNGPVCFGWQPTLGQGLSLLNVEHSITLFGKSFGVIGGTGFFLSTNVFDTAVFALFLFQMVFMDTTATIPTGSMAERWNFKNFVIYGFWVGMIPYAIFGNWVWGGGWLAQLGQNFGLGHGAVDFAGSGVVHLCGGVIALWGTVVMGARLGKFDKNGKPNAMPAHDVPMVMLGTFILAFGWFGFNPGSTLAGTDLRFAIVAVNTMLAGAAASVATLLTMYIMTGKPDPTMLCNGLLAGLVAITAPCAFVNSGGAVVIGAIAGTLVVFSVFFIERTLKLDDPVGAMSVHGVCGAFGVLSVGLFANGTYGQGWGGVHKLFKDGAWQIINTNADGAKAAYDGFVAGGWTDVGVSGIFSTLFGGVANDFDQIKAQFAETLACFIFVGLMAFIWFKLSNLIFPLRSTREDEIAGLDIPEMGVEAYPDFQTTDKTSPAIT